MKVGELMIREAEVASPEDTLREAAAWMAELYAGALPADEGDRLVGMLPDRDIAVRAVARDKRPDTKVREAMTPEVRYCLEDEDLDGVVRDMGEDKVRRPPVPGRDERLVGIVSFGDVTLSADSGRTDTATSAAPGPGGPHARAA